MKHCLPTVIEPYETKTVFRYQKSTLSRTPGMTFINGKPQKHVAGRKSDLAAEIIAKGRNKVPVENKKGLWNGCFCLWLEENS